MHNFHRDPSEPSSSEDEGNESDKELQIALSNGLLKREGLNYVGQEKRPPINNANGLLAKLTSFKRDLEWVERLDITTDPFQTAEEASATVKDEGLEDDDFQRELRFYKQAQRAASLAFPKLKKLGVPVFRPDDYFAEMVKSDQHMDKVRRKLRDVQTVNERREAARRLREEKRFASKVQQEVLADRQTNKRKLLEAVKKHRKGMASQLDVMLENAKSMQNDQEEDADEATTNMQFNSKFAQKFPIVGGKQGGGSKSRVVRDKKYGFGGRKKRSKMNTKESYGDYDTPGKNRIRVGKRGTGGAKGGGKKKGGGAKNRKRNR